MTHAGPEMDARVAQVWSCGGGTQSVAIAALIIQGKLPKPDHALIVDTTRERSRTWAYADAVLIPKLAAFGVDLVRVNRDDYTDIDLYSGADGDELIMPVYTLPAGRRASFCSGEWKRDVAMRYMRKTLRLDAAVGWIGYSTDELRRVSTPRRKWYQFRYPLIDDVPMNRAQCVSLIARMGWPPPPRSSCWMCPHHSDAEWREMKEHEPDDFNKAVQLEREIREKDSGMYLSPRRIPLDQINFANEPSLFTGSDCVGECFT